VFSVDTADKIEYCQWCGCVLDENNRVVLGEDPEKGAITCICDECARNIFLTGGADMFY
jgi:hypothetical protein